MPCSGVTCKWYTYFNNPLLKIRRIIAEKKHADERSRTDPSPRYTGHTVNKTGNVRITYFEARSYNHCCSRKTINITYSEYMFVG